MNRLRRFIVRDNLIAQMKAEGREFNEIAAFLGIKPCVVCAAFQRWQAIEDQRLREVRSVLLRWPRVAA